MVNRGPCREDHCREIGDVDLLLTKLLRAEPLNLDERTEVDFYSLFLGDIVVGRLVGRWLRLGDQYFLYFHSFSIYKVQAC